MRFSIKRPSLGPRYHLHPEDPRLHIFTQGFSQPLFPASSKCKPNKSHNPQKIRILTVLLFLRILLKLK